MFLLISNKFPILNFQNILTAAYLLFITSSLIVIFVYDLKHYIIPDKVIYPAILVSLAFIILNFIRNWELSIRNFNVFQNFGLSLIGALFFLFLILISKGQWMGLGDVKLAVLMGLFLGWPKILPALFFAFLSGALIGVLLILIRKKNFKSQVPFGPFLIFGTLIAFFWGVEIINWYLNFNF